MINKRDLVREIIEVRERNRSGHAQGELWSRITALERVYDEFDKDNIELLKYFPIALVGCVESYFRLIIKEIIDAGEDYVGAASKLVEKGKIDFELIKAFHGQKISLGEFVSHIIRISSLNQIDSVMSTLLSTQYLDKLATVYDRNLVETHGKLKDPIIYNKDVIYSDVTRTFELRHIYCHELASREKPDYNEIDSCFFSSLFFMKAADEYHHQLLYPGPIMGQQQMNHAVAEHYGEVRKDLDEIHLKVSTFLSKKRYKEFISIHKSWEKYRDKEAKFNADVYRGGTLWSYIYSRTATEITNKRIKEAKEYLAQLEEYGGESP
ncbi:MAG: lysozyme inhibitor LprI family protein [Geobacteraceae bacterium]|nr:lysozyme inhibitor LprI family protein [Geobacteraceae bacterium]